VISQSAIGHKDFSKEAVDVLLKYSFPGNIRELKNIVERLLILKEGDLIGAEDVKSLLTEAGSGKEVSLLQQPYKDAKRNFEKLYIEEKLKENTWNISKTAKELGIERPNLHRKMRELGISTRGSKE